MANTQLIIFTAVPQNLVFDPDTIKVSVLVSPRLSGVTTWARTATG